jgi:nuclear GTP-binding protein
VIEAADVVIEVLDARDPLGSRCPQVEEAVISQGTKKKLVLLLNKIGKLYKCDMKRLCCCKLLS